MRAATWTVPWPLFEEQGQVCREKDPIGFLLESLEVQAQILSRSGDPDRAVVRLQEKEQIYRDRGDLDGVSRSLNLQAEILGEGGDSVGPAPA